MNDKVVHSGAGSETRTAKPAGRRLRLPFVIAGKNIAAVPGEEQLVEAPGGVVAMPGIGLLDDILPLSENLLADVSTQDIISFLHRVGKMWESDEYIRRRIYIKQMCEFTGYSEQMATAEADLIAATLRGGARLWDTLQAELGDRAILDQWVRREDCEVRALPKGLVVHVLAGNVPIAAVLSVLRSLLTRNQTIVKVASGDPVTATQLALSFLDLDAQHPVSRSLHTLYWPNNSRAGASIVEHADGVCVWGGADAVAWAHRHARPGVDVVTFGPKRSFSVIRADAGDDIKTAARLVAHDISMYDQQACFSTQHVFVLGDCTAFAAALADALEHSRKIIPPPLRNIDQAAAVRLTRSHHEFFGAAIACAEDGAWQVIVASPEHVHRHPGARTALLHPIENFDDVYAAVDKSVQTVAAHPWSMLQPHRDRLAKLGVSRLVEAGLSGTFRLGASHDGFYPLARLVRFVSIEAPSSVHSKGMTMALDMSKIVEHRQFRDLFV